MNDESVEGLMKDRFELGGEAAAGAGTDALMHAAILSYSRSRGVFAGANLKGVVVRPEDDLNRAVYDQTARDLLSDGAGAAAPSDGLKAFPEALGRATADAGSGR
jgi:SH3 domain-containing YSC84-like protein 1